MMGNDNKAKSDPAPKGDASHKAIQDSAQADSGRKETDASAGYSRGGGQNWCLKPIRKIGT